MAARKRLRVLLAALALACSAAAALPGGGNGGGGVVLGRRGDAGGGAPATPPRGLELGGRRYRLQLRYTACTGLVNQQYSHIAAFTLAAALGVAEVHLPPAAVRDSFGHMFSTHQDQNQMQWFPARAGALLDVRRLQRAWTDMGIAVHEPHTLLPFPDLMFPAGAFQLTALPGIDPRAVVRIDGVYLAGLDLHQLVTHVTQTAEAHLSRVYAAFPGLQLNELLLELPCTFFALHTASMLPVVSQVASTLHFNPNMEYLADRVVSYITRDGRRKFNGAHLRVEKDAAEWFIILGGAQAVWDLYIETMRDNQFEHTTPLYIATGLLSYGAELEFAWGLSMLTGNHLCSEVLYKEQYMPPYELERLNSEQLALLDFLILARAEKFVGFGPSTFSFYLREHRMLHGRPPQLSVLVNASKIGTDEVFSRSARIALGSPDPFPSGVAAGGGDAQAAAGTTTT